MADNNEFRWSASQTDWRAYAEKLAKDNSSVGMSRNASDNNSVLQNRGMFDFQSMLNDFYGYKPDKDDTEGRMLKRSFQTNAIQSVMDTEMAKSLSSHTTGNSIDVINATADAELRNKLAVNDQEFNYGMQKIGYESDLLLRDRGGNQKDVQSALINAQGGVDIDKIRAAGDEDRKGQNNAQRLNNLQKEQDRGRARSLARSF